jgi:hypothetical protein
MSIYAFGGAHLGWLDDGIVRDREGFAAGFLKGAVNVLTRVEPVKGVKKIAPIRGIRQLSPVSPLFRDMWSSVPLTALLTSRER